MKRLLLLLFLFSSFVGLQAARKALVIGNGDYGEASLPNAINDARDMHQALLKLGFESTLKLNLNKEEMEETADEFALSLGRMDEAVFFYSGHGAQYEGANYLIPVNSRIVHEKNIPTRAYKLEEIRYYLEDTAFSVLILDACRNNPFRNSRDVRSRGMAIMEPGSQYQCIFFSTGNGETADDGDGKNSPFTDALLRHIPKPGVNIHDLMKMVAIDVKNTTNGKQIPRADIPLTANFYFNPAKPNVPGTTIESKPPIPQQEKPRDPFLHSLELQRQQAEEDKKILEQARVMQEELKKLSVQTPSSNDNKIVHAPVNNAIETPPKPVTVVIPESVTPSLPLTPPVSSPASKIPETTSTNTALKEPIKTPPQKPAPEVVPQKPIQVAKAEAIPTEEKRIVDTTSVETVAKEPEPIPEVQLTKHMILVEGGGFHNGSAFVKLSPFYLCKYEVTQDDYFAVTGKKLKSGMGGDFPIYSVSWFDAIEFCNMLSLQEELTPCYTYGGEGDNPKDWDSKWKEKTTNHIKIRFNTEADGYRLPTEMEWMYAAKGGNKTGEKVYPKYAGPSTIEQLGAYAWYLNSKTEESAQRVGLKLPNHLGLFDMSGNLYEWVWDIFDKRYPDFDQTNPTGPDKGPRRIIRGGCWAHEETYCQIKDRTDVSVDTSTRVIGFRVARNAMAK